jgi:RecA-family ATPase
MAKLRPVPDEGEAPDMGGADIVALDWCPPTLTDWLAQVDENVRWLIPDFVPEDSLILLSGQQKRAFKTWFALTCALATALGRDVGGLKPTRAGPVLFIEEEGARASTKSRFKMLLNTYMIAPEELSNVYFAHRNRIKLDDQGWRARLSNFMAAKQPALVVYDGLSFAHTGDENSHKDMSPVIDTLQLLRSFSCSTLLLAHVDKQRGENPHADIDIQVRGSSIIINSYDTHIAMRRYKMSDAHITCTVRSRDAEEKEFVVSWDIDEEKNHAALSYHKKHNENEPKTMTQDSISRYKLILETAQGDKFSNVALRRLWELGTKTANMVRDILLKEGFLVPEGASYALAQRAEIK